MEWRAISRKTKDWQTFFFNRDEHIRLCWLLLLFFGSLAWSTWFRSSFGNLTTILSKFVHAELYNSSSMELSTAWRSSQRRISMQSFVFGLYSVFIAVRHSLSISCLTFSRRDPWLKLGTNPWVSTYAWMIVDFVLGWWHSYNDAIITGVIFLARACVYGGGREQCIRTGKMENDKIPRDEFNFLFRETEFGKGRNWEGFCLRCCCVLFVWLVGLLYPGKCINSFFLHLPCVRANNNWER